ncbi:MAG: transposase [Deltaproteobacteria bacterium]|nr:transposase [Deltaproteobacteria bacterium]
MEGGGTRNKYNPEIHHRHSIRLKDYDYRQAGGCFVTVCTQNRECLFGDVVDGEMRLNEAGRMTIKTWIGLTDRFPFIELDEFVVMPNHMHGIILIVGVRLGGPNKGAASSAPTLGDVMRTFKSIAAININRLLERTGRPLWQRNYYEHIIRNEEDLNRIREYITNNPTRWAEDEDNPENIKQHANFFNICKFF